MPGRATALLPTFAIALLATLVSAAPKATPARPGTATPTSPITGVCAVPDAKTCLSTVTSGSTEISYLETECGKKNRATCAPFVRDAFKSDPGRGKAPKKKVLKVGGTDIPLDPKSTKGDLRDGRGRIRYGKPKKGRALAVQGKSVLARSGLTVAPAFSASTADLAAVPKHDKWEANGQKIESCREYAYEKLYDALRFSDAAAKCASDRQCEYDVAYMKNTPGIASRTLKRKDGAAIPHQLPVRKKGKLAKNDMYTAVTDFVFSGDPVLDELDPTKAKRQAGIGIVGVTMKSTPALAAQAKSMKTGAKWYSFGCKGSECGERKLVDEWDFHRQLGARNATVSEAEFDEYARRKAEFRRLYDEWRVSADEGASILVCMLNPIDCRGTDMVARVTPIDMVSIDPMERMDLMQETFENGVVRAGNMATQKVPAGAQIPGGGAQVQPSASWRGGARPAVAVLGSPAPMPKSVPAKPTTPKVRPARCDPSHWEGDYPGTKWTGNDHNPYVSDVYFSGPAACRLGDFLREESRRKQRGMKSCLDLDDDDCDWSTDMFHDRFVAGYPYGAPQNKLEQDCLTFTGDKFVDIDNIQEADDYIAAMRKKAGKALKALEPYHDEKITVEGKQVWELGNDWIDGEAFGDKDWFAAGYDYDVGWSVRPADLASDSAKNICDLSGDAHAKFNIDTWLVKNDMRVLEANFKTKLNENDKGKTHIKASVEILGDDVFTPLDENFQQTWTADGSKSKTLPTPKPTFTFPAGPIPVSGSVWASLLYGANASGSAQLQSAGGCDPDKVTFDVDSRVDPFVSVAGAAQIGVGIAGIASAGIRGSLTLVSLGVPLDAKLEAYSDKVEGVPQNFLKFTSTLSLTLSTLSGYMAVYIEFLFYTDEWEIFSWNGLSSEVALMDPALEADLPLVAWPQ